MEVLSPAGSPEALRAAVMSGADAVYLGGLGFNARANARNFSREEISDGIRFCHERGVRVYATMNTLISDREMRDALKTAEVFTEAGIDAFIVQDVGFARCLRLSLGDSVPLHASTQMTVCSADGAEQMLDMGFRRVVLNRELSAADIAYIAKNVPIQTEVFVHGALCMCYSGQCYMSSVIGGRSGNRGECAQPCRLPYRNGYELSLKDNCLLEYVPELKKMGVTSLKIEGRMKGAEYVAAVTDAYVRAVKGEVFSEDRKAYLASVFSRDGFTDGYYTGKTGREMFGVRKKDDVSVRVPLPTREYKRFSLDFSLTSDDSYVVRLAGSSSDGFCAETSFPAQKARNRVTGEEELRKALDKLGDTPYELGKVRSQLPDDIFIPVSLLNEARRTVVESITGMRCIRPQSMISRIPEINTADTPSKGLRGQFLFPSQVPDNAGKLDIIWLPLEKAGQSGTAGIIEKFGDKVGFFLPTAVHDSEYPVLDKLLDKADNLGVRQLLCENVGLVRHCLERGFRVHGGCGLNVYNSISLDRFEDAGLESVMLSFELTMRAAESIADGKSGIFAYGRLPFMTVRNCIKGDGRGCALKDKPKFLTDRMGKDFFVTCDFGCRNRIWNADVLWLADRLPTDAGFLHLMFTDETRERVAQVIEGYSGGECRKPGDITRGLYYR